MRVFESYDMYSIEGVMRPGDVYMEIGVHKGRFFEGSGLRRLDCVYVFYEPNETVVGSLSQVLRRAFPGNEIARLAIHPVAVWSSESEMDYYVDASEGQGNTLVPGVHTRVAGRVKTITLEQATKGFPRVRFLAINAEQAEYEILKSPAMDKVDYVTVEFHPGKSGIDTKTFVAEHLPQFETLAFGREGDAYNMWLGRRRDVG